MSTWYVTRALHRLHRSFGTALFALLASWFASGAVMTVAPFPSFSERERLASERPLSTVVATLPSTVSEAIMRGERVRLVDVEGKPTWLFDTPAGRRAAGLTPFDATRARREIERRFGTVEAFEPLDEPDQWSVAQRSWPLFRARLANGDDVYLAANTGEIVQQSTCRERVWAWLGAIPHWIYFTPLRRERALWRYTVLGLAALGLVVTGSGLIAGGSLALRLRRPIRDRSLRWHQRIGLAFGLLASSWLFSGALSLRPFQWSEGDVPSEELFRATTRPTASAIERALWNCQMDIEVRELELGSLAGRTYAVCFGVAGSRIVDLATGVARESLPARTLPSATWESAPDAYFYPTHDGDDFPAHYWRLALNDRQGSQLYIDPKRARLLLQHTDRSRLERWLYHGLHSFDLPGLYDQPRLWRVAIWLAMAAGFVVSALGGWLAVRRGARRARSFRAAHRGPS